MLWNESTHPWHDVKPDFADSKYCNVCHQQMKELEMEDDLRKCLSGTCEQSYLMEVSWWLLVMEYIKVE